MKAKRRHQLQHNVLDAELAKTIEFFKKRGWTIVWVVLAVIAVWTGISMWRTSRAHLRAQIETKHAGVHARVAMSDQKPEVLLAQLDELIDQTRVPRISAQACVDAGDVCSRQAQIAALALEAGRMSGLPKGALDILRKEYDDHRARARGYYERARDDLPDQYPAVAKAHFGLAELAEAAASLLEGDERRKAFEAALDEYRAVGKIGSAGGHPVAALAEGEIKRLYDVQKDRVREDYCTRVRMATTRPAAPSTQPASRPATKPAKGPVGE